MIKSINRFICKFYDKPFATLSVESLLFSVLFGIALHNWIVAVVMLLGSSWLLSKAKGAIYMVIAMSLLWGFMAASIGYSFGGWLWASALGSLVLIQGLRIHWRKLGLSWVDLHYGVKDGADFRSPWDLRRQSLN